jgi:hypothetical protein
MKLKALLALAMSTTFLAACGGGGGDGAPATIALSPTQTNFEAAALKGTYSSFDWSLPTTNVTPVNGTHFFLAHNFSAAASPSAGPQVVIETTSNMTRTLGLPTMSNRNVDRVLKSGVIYVTNSTSKGAFSYVGNDVVSTAYATDGLTPLFASVYDSWSTPIALTGQIGTATILKSFLGFTRLNTPNNLDFSQSWLAGSSYFTRKGYRQADTVFVYDTSGTTFNANVTPVPTTVLTLEDLFNSAAFTANGGVLVDGVVYPFSAGSIRSIEGVRTWVATNKRPASASATEAFVVLFELNGKIYYGNLEKAGTRFKFIDGVDNTIVNDYSIRINATAAASIKQAVKF